MAATQSNGVEAEIEACAARAAETVGVEVVDVRYRRHGRKWLLRVDIDRPGPGGVGLGDCERVSAALGADLEEADVVDGSYVLEVSSPGLDRPIRTDDDVRRNTGRRVIVETTEPVEGRRQFRGVLMGLDGQNLRVRDDDGIEVRIARPGILRAHQEIEFS